MKTRRILLGSLLLLLAACQGPGWKQFTSREGGFSVEMPGTPVPETKRLPPSLGGIELHFLVADLGDRAYTVSYCDYPKDAVETRTPEQILKDARDGALANVSGKLESERPLPLGKYPGQELRIAARGKTVYSRTYLVEKRIYSLDVAGPPNETSSPEATRFLDSFKLLPR